MNLPNAAAAVVDIRKLVDYALDPDSPRGRHKAVIFRASLGIAAENAAELKRLLLEAVVDAECEVGERVFLVRDLRSIVELSLVIARR